MKTSELKILCSMRVRLNADERQLLKEAYRKQQSFGQQAPMPLVNRGSGIAVEHSQIRSGINQRLGLPHIVVVDILSSRDAISFPLSCCSRKSWALRLSMMTNLLTLLKAIWTTSKPLSFLRWGIKLSIYGKQTHYPY